MTPQTSAQNSGTHHLRHRLLLGAIFLAAVSVGPVLAQDLDVSQEVSVAIGNEPPYTELKPDGTLSGAGPDIDRAALLQSGFKNFSGVTMAYGAMIPALQASRVRMVSSGALNIRPERCDQVIFSEPVMCTAQAFLVRHDFAGRVNSYKQAADLGIKVGVPAGSIQGKDALDRGIKAENIVNFPDNTSAVKMLQDRRIDAIALNGDGVLDMKKRSGDVSLEVVIPVTDTPIDCAAAAFNKSDTALRDAYNAGLEKLIKGGEFAEIMGKYSLQANVALRSKAKSTAEMCSR
ncbi:ectoine/hydroxyectoine ABC transporter substrate-binding protein EhuB [Rhizobium sp. 1AS11]|uniref:ectoine/hydroxyectoine ABC transporter substrate-binding protein EhuB n=1 Tax=Rhizobium acaciae TaxID=2989736 RepID=UPI002222891E|nr:ectoine/hydroxyectoine ABC transporter substrate-binding protein EhuB [Rhizobium acaciae]MCW1410675.1 ectoine/hydroxyectoine ABC transporter substrate-binding protein EhuB [Rhizobium acaciae]MCW1743026.1 ectoine/hydroxyectoine ABC transporter substrate-binding protein EhuB [Rhizobium acaciae]